MATRGGKRKRGGRLLNWRDEHYGSQKAQKRAASSVSGALLCGKPFAGAWLGTDDGDLGDTKTEAVVTTLTAMDYRNPRASGKIDTEPASAPKINLMEALKEGVNQPMSA